MIIIAQVRSGGQTGVDEAAIRAAKARAVPTGGVMPRGFKTLIGPRPDFDSECCICERNPVERGVAINFGTRFGKMYYCSECVKQLSEAERRSP